jgi:hypothetical protein
MRESRLQAVRQAEFKLLQKPAEMFDGRVWACRKWANGCADRIVEIPPYGDTPPTDRCSTHGLPMDTKTAESRTVSAAPEDQA